MGIMLLIATIAAVNRDYSHVSDNANNSTQNSEAKDKTDTESIKVEDKDKPASEVTINNSDTTDKKSDSVTVTKDFTFTAEPGASYTALAREAVRKYATENKITVNDSQIEEAAARLAHNAGSPYLNIGQEVVISNNDISAIVGSKTESTTPPVADTTPPPSDTANKPAEKPVEKSFTFVASSGDNYSQFARSAISDYATNNNLKLSGAQRIAAETFIISDAGFPGLAIGQQVTFSNDTIKNAVDKAMSLSPSQLINWQPYANLAGL